MVQTKDQMTMPHLSNCSHRPDGWCLACVANLHADSEMLTWLIRQGPPGAAFGDWGLTELLWELACAQITDEQKRDTDQILMRQAIADAMTLGTPDPASGPVTTSTLG